MIGDRNSHTHLHTTTTFEAAHKLAFLPTTHKCSRLHGHSYQVDFEIWGLPDADGMLVDYADLHAITEALDHRYLNEIEGLDKPTTENVAMYIAARAKLLNVHPAFQVTVRVYEGAHKHFAEVSM